MKKNQKPKLQIKGHWSLKLLRKWTSNDTLYAYDGPRTDEPMSKVQHHSRIEHSRSSNITAFIKKQIIFYLSGFIKEMLDFLENHLHHTHI